MRIIVGDSSERTYENVVVTYFQIQLYDLLRDEATKVLSQDGVSAILYLQPEPPKYEVRVLVAIT